MRHYEFEDLYDRGKIIQSLIENFGAVKLESKPRQTGFTYGKEEDDGRTTKQDDR